MPEVLSHNALSELIGLIYDCALDPNRWERTLAAIMDAFSGRTAILTLMDQRRGRLLLSRTVGIEPYQMEAVARHAPEINARIEEAFASEGFSRDAPYTLSHHWRREDIETSPYVGGVREALRHSRYPPVFPDSYPDALLCGGVGPA
jgi:hypothetical protein